MDISARGPADLSAPLGDPGCRLQIPLRLAFEEFDPRTLSFVEARACSEDGQNSSLVPLPNVTIQPIGSSQPIPFPVTLKEEGGPFNTLVFCVALQAAPTNDLINGRFEVVLTFGSLRSVALRLTFEQSQVGKLIQVSCEPVGSASGALLRNALLIGLSCSMLLFWYAKNENTGVVGNYDGWILSKAKLSFYAGLVLGFVGLQFQFLRQLATHLEGWRAFIRFPQLYLDASLLWLLGKRATTLLLVLANALIMSRVVVEWPRSLPELPESNLAYWNSGGGETVAAPARIWTNAANAVTVRCGTSPKDRSVVGQLPTSLWWRRDILAPAPEFIDFAVDMESDMGTDRSISGQSLATIGTNPQGLPAPVAHAIDTYVCGTPAVPGPQVVVEASGSNTLVVRWYAGMSESDLLFGVDGMLRRLQTRSFTNAASCLKEAACKTELDQFLPTTGVVNSPELIDLVREKIEPGLSGSDQRVVSDMLVALRVVLARFVDRHGQDLSSKDVKYLASVLGKTAPNQNPTIATALMELGVDLAAWYPTDTCPLDAIHPAIAKAGGEVYLEYLEAAASKGILKRTNSCSEACHEFLKAHGRTMQQMANFETVVDRVRGTGTPIAFLLTQN